MENIGFLHKMKEMMKKQDLSKNKHTRKQNKTEKTQQRNKQKLGKIKVLIYLCSFLFFLVCFLLLFVFFFIFLVICPVVFFFLWRLCFCFVFSFCFWFIYCIFSEINFLCFVGLIEINTRWRIRDRNRLVWWLGSVAGRVDGLAALRTVTIKTCEESSAGRHVFL